jgi:hypothetical protein
MLEQGGIGGAEWTAIEQVVRRLTESYPHVPSGTVATVVHHNHARFDGRPIRDFVPLFVERGSRKELAELQA